MWRVLPFIICFVLGIIVGMLIGIGGSLWEEVEIQTISLYTGMVVLILVGLIAFGFQAWLATDSWRRDHFGQEATAGIVRPASVPTSRRDDFKVVKGGPADQPMSQSHGV